MALADKEFGEEVIRNPPSESKDTSTKAAKDRRHLTIGRVTNSKGVVRLRVERTARCTEKKKRLKTAKKKKEAVADSDSAAASSSKSTQKGALVEGKTP